MIASFATKVFSVSQKRIYTLDEISRTGALNIEEQEVDGQKPSTYIKGPGLDEFSFTIPFVRQSGLSIGKEIEDWMNIRNMARPHMFILGNSPISNNKYLLVNVSVSDVVLDSKGNYVRAKVELQFKEFVRYGAKKEETTGTGVDSKKEKKRENKNAKKAKTDSKTKKSKKTSNKKGKSKKSDSKSKKTSSKSSGKNSSKLDELEKEIFG
ncbi:hypothetical protein CLPU_6c00470 [Gottschalkia purinilytica]|uniref:Uncharacterized protein n=1 Tax=Gottschalkia purinilytica TaxID=1503 RepID=A0A0L0WAP0_GOTPU|nr:phage tail protein [Gottschalkia purinilytica]KNF08561.1 hypothetical protein CLPU_6c00470 [Gottschalkia purinilytica]